MKEELQLQNYKGSTKRSCNSSADDMYVSAGVLNCKNVRSYPIYVKKSIISASFVVKKGMAPIKYALIPPYLKFMFYKVINQIVLTCESLRRSKRWNKILIDIVLQKYLE